MRELRLLHLQIADINRQRLAVGASPVTSAANPTGYQNPRAIQTAASNQTVGTGTPWTTQQLNSQGQLTNISGTGPMRYQGAVGVPAPDPRSIQQLYSDAQKEYLAGGAVSPETRAAAERKGLVGIEGAESPTNYAARLRTQIAGLQTPTSYTYDPYHPEYADRYNQQEGQRQQQLATAQNALSAIQGAQTNAPMVASAVTGLGGTSINSPYSSSVTTNPVTTPRTTSPTTVAGYSSSTQQTPTGQGNPTYTSQTPTGTPQTSPEAPGSMTTGQTQQGGQGQSQPGMSDLPPELQGAYSPIVASADAIGNLANQQYQLEMAGLSQDAQNAGILRENSITGAEKAFRAQTDFNSRIDSAARDRNSEIERQNLADNEVAQTKFDLEQTRAEQLQRDQNLKDELTNRRYLNKTGQTFDSGGIQWAQDELRKGNEALSYVVSQAANGDKDFLNQRTKIINNYRLDMNDADNNAIGAYQMAYSNYQTSIRSANTDYAVTTKDIRKDRTTARDKYYTALGNADKTKAEAYRDASLKVWDAHVELQKQEITAKQWKADYEFKVTQANNQMSFEQDKFSKEYNQKSQELKIQGATLALNDFQKQFDMRATTIAGVKNDIQTDKSVSAYEVKYRPAWDQFEVAYNDIKKNGESDEARQSLASAFTQLTDGVQSSDPNLWATLTSYVPLIGSTIPTLTKSGKNMDIEKAHTLAQSFYSKAQERKNLAVDKAMSNVQQSNLRFTSDIFKITPEDVGLKTTPLNHEVLQTLATLPPDIKNKIGSYDLGGKPVTTNYEMQLRLQEADRMFFADTGQHIKVAESYRSPESQAVAYAKFQAGTGGRAAPPGQSEHQRGAAVDIAESQWKIAEPYLVAAGIKQLPSAIDQEDAGHFSLTQR